MIIIQDPQISSFSECSYLPEHLWRFEYFFAMGLDGYDLEELLSHGWRKFGLYFFRPNCSNCFECVPLRVLVQDYKFSKSHKRVLKKGKEIKVDFKPLEYRDDIYEIYKNHSLNRFNKETDVDEFMTTFYTESCPSIQSEFYLNDELFAVGFLDVTSTALSSVYFIYNTDYEEYSPGVFSILKEIEYVKSLGLKYYYLGYYIKNNHSMSYKNNYYPHELYNWKTKEWKLITKP